MKEPKFITYDAQGFEHSMSPYGYSALWGCEEIYDKPPRKKGDGNLFYNFSSQSSKYELKQLVGAIERTIEQVKDSRYVYERRDVEDLTKLKKWVEYLIERKLNEA